MYKIEILLPAEVGEDDAAHILRDLLSALSDAWNITADGACFTVVPEVQDVPEN
jgi:hypothetical protein